MGRDGSVLPGACDPSAIAASAGLHGSGTTGDPALSSEKEELANLQGQPPRRKSTRTLSSRESLVSGISPGCRMRRTVANCPDITRNIAFILHTEMPTTTTESGVLRPFRSNGLGVRVSDTR
ncbi:uncharacterized protein LOC128092707 [Culex pipiens pallens]|uniref:uncharacterized protein LOC128092707 n=1 Tax=Culex pipiens pallens TaxID=42434 RepID=UPI0022AA538A|nr:uncharacterized protein LOC128092707 [Culex pipiens pallens]